MVDPKTLTDAELVAAVASKVMGPTVRMMYGAWWFGDELRWQHLWAPLTDWNDTQLVIEATAIWPYADRKAFQDTLMKDGNWYADISQRDILEAALAVRIISEPEQKAVTS